VADVFETSRVVLRCTVVRGQSSSNKATFSVMRGGTEFKSQEVALTGDKAYLTIEKLPDVKPDEASWDLTYKVTCDGQSYDGAEVSKVWPLKLKLKAVDDKAAAVKSVRWIVRQNGEERFAQTRPDGTVVHYFRWPAPFTVDVVDAFRLVKWNKETGRDLEGEVDDRVDPDFESPAQPADKKQYVNLDTASGGADGKAHLVTFKVFAKGPGGVGKGGKAKNKIFIEVTFGMETPPDAATFGSLLNTPVRALKGALDIKPAQPRKKTYTGYVELPADGGTATFQVELGTAGGDTCTVTLGGAPADCAAGPKREFQNWRKLEYVVYAPDFMTLADKQVNAKACKDLPAATVAQIKLRADKAFFEYVLKDSYSFAEAAATAGCVKPGAFVGSAAPKVYLLSDHTVKDAPGGAPDKTDPRVMILKLCDMNYYCEDPSATVARVATANPFVETVGANDFFVKVSGKNGTNAVKSITWTAKLTAASYFKFPTLEWKDAAAPTTAGAVNGHVIIHEMLQDKRLDLTFAKPTIGHIKTSLSDSETAKIQPFIDGLLASADTLRANGNKLKLELIGEAGNDRRSSRFTLVKGAVDSAFNGSPNRKKASTHPGVDDAGNAKTGVLDCAADVEEDDHKKFKVNLPGLPGQLVNATVTADKCPLDLIIDYEVAASGLGLCSNRENLVVYVPTSPNCTTDTLLHELGHSMAMVYFAGTNTGKPLPSGLTSPTKVPAGNAYDEHGGSGTHCAHGMGNKALASFSGGGGTCIMFHEGPSVDPNQATEGFCDECSKYIRATDLTALK
jgi:hypothetical protein